MRDLSSNDQATLVYLILLLIVIGGSMLIGSRRQLNRTLQQISIWVLIFVGLLGAYSMRDQIEQQLFPSRPQLLDSGSVAINRAWDGHFYVELQINNKTVEFVVDTGATNIVLRREDAEKIGIDLNTLNFSERASTANGIVATAPVTLRAVSLGRFIDSNLRASVNGGELDKSLLGMEYLDRFSKIEITQGRMLLIRQ